MKLNKVLSFYDVFLASTGFIIGAGIYSLLGITTKYGGKFTWLSFLIGGFIALMTGLSYADLSIKYDSSASDYDYITKTLSDKTKYVTAYVVISMGIFIFATLNLSFSNYINKIFKIPINLTIILTIILVTLINIFSIRHTANINNIISLLEIGVLVVLSILAFIKLDINKIIVNNFDKQPNLRNIIQGSFISIFTLLGFDAITKLSEETKKSKKTIPLAIVSSIIFSTFLYILVSISCNSLLGHKQISTSNTPITDTFNKLLGSKTSNTINVIAILSIFNTILLTQLFSSRQLYAISKRGIFPKFLSNINNKTFTPIYSIITVGILGLIITSIENLELVTKFCNFITLILFILINLSSLILRLKDNKYRGYYLKYPIHSILGILGSLFMLLISIKNNYFKDLSK